MNTITIEVESTEKKEVEIHCPSFMRNKDESKYVGILDEKTVVTIHKNEGLTIVSNGELWLFKSDIREAHFNFYSCTEEEFLEAFDAAVQSMSLHPTLAV